MTTEEASENGSTMNVRACKEIKCVSPSAIRLQLTARNMSGGRTTSHASERLRRIRESVSPRNVYPQ